MPRDYFKGNISPLSARLFSSYDQLPDKFYLCGLENIYMPSNFPNIEIIIKIHFQGLTHKGVYAFFTMKAAVISGYPECENFWSVSVHETNQAHFFYCR